jgi:putative ABC transport system permease protein
VTGDTTELDTAPHHSTLRSWRVALRLARRETRRAKGRTALIVAMIGLPVLGLSFAVTTYDMQQLTPAETASRVMGTAAAIAYRTGDGTAVETPLAASGPSGSDGGPHRPADIASLLPAGATTTAIWSAASTVRTSGGIATVTTYGVDAADPLARGYLTVLHGRAPRTDDEVAVSSTALSRIGTRVGGTVTTAAGAVYRVVGVADIAGQMDDYLVFPADRPPADATGDWLIGQSTPMLLNEINRLNAAGITVQSRAYVLDRPAPAAADFGIRYLGSAGGLTSFSVTTVVAGLGLLEVVLLAGPAFAVGARRRQRELALVATNGGTPGMLRRIVLADGLVSGLIAAVVGGLGGVLVAFAVRGPVQDDLFHVRFGGYRTHLGWLLVIGAVAVGTGLIAALMPAVSAGQQDVVAALSGRRGTQRSRMRWLTVGLGLVAVGGFLVTDTAFGRTAQVILIGLVLGEFGMVLCTPMLVGWVARIGRFLPPAPRIALRDTARRRASAAPAISAVMAAVAGSIAVTVYLGTVDKQPSAYIPAAPAGSVFVNLPTADPIAAGPVEDALNTVFPGIRQVRYDTMWCNDDAACGVSVALPADQVCPYQGGPYLSTADQRRARRDARCANDDDVIGATEHGPIVTDDPTVVAMLTGLSGPRLDAAVDTLRSGGVLLSVDRYIENGTARLDDGTASEMTVPAMFTAYGSGANSSPIMSPLIVPRIKGASVHLGGVIGAPGQAPTVAQQDRLASMLESQDASVVVESGPSATNDPLPLLLAIAAGAVALGAAGIATGLAAADSRHDLSTLGAVGATPGVRRRLSLAQAGIIAGLGALLGAVAGYAAAAAVITGVNHQWSSEWPGPDLMRITVPWLNFGISLVAVPLVAMAAAGLLTRSRLPSERRST